MAKITIDGKAIEVEDGIALIQACEIAGITIPRFCYHDRLKIAGNCRMCLVEVAKSPKPVASCAMPVSDGMEVFTDSAKVQQARQGVMEFLLINHPLDCPICDKGGECDLQDQSYKYGNPTSRYQEIKRGVSDKYMGPLIQTHMTRCIHCTRCIRFMEDVAGTSELGAIGRGENMEVSSYLGRSITSELSGNIIDLCPVGALNSKPYAYTARKWELKSTKSLDVFDAMCSNITLDSRGLEVMRVLPSINEDINEEWISDRIRFSYDGLKNQRIDKSYIRKNGKLIPTSIENALEKIASTLRLVERSKIGAIAGIMTDLETMYITKLLLNRLGSSNVDYNQFGYNIDASSRGNYLFNTRYKGLEESDLLIVIGCNIRKNAPVLGARISKLEKAGNLSIYSIGESIDEAFASKYLGHDAAILNEIEEGIHPLSEVIKTSKKPTIIIGDGVYLRKDGLAICASIERICSKFGVINDIWNGFNILHNHASTVGALDLGFYNAKKSLSASQMVKNVTSGELQLLFLLDADEIAIPETSKGMIVYIGHHGDLNAGKADIIIPAYAFSEKDASYMNNEAIIQKAYASVRGPVDALPDYEIIMRIGNLLNIDFGFKDLAGLRYEMSKFLETRRTEHAIKFSSNAKITHESIKPRYVNFYLSNSISRASKTMASCARELLHEAL